MLMESASIRSIYDEQTSNEIKYALLEHIEANHRSARQLAICDGVCDPENRKEHPFS